jgi:ABC-type transport system involved in multi-copper enzyme maturation permease subunit
VKGLSTIVKKELADHISSYRFTIIFALIAILSLVIVYMVGQDIKLELERALTPSIENEMKVP